MALGLLFAGSVAATAAPASLPYDNSFEYAAGALNTTTYNEWSVTNGGAQIVSSPVMTGLGSKSCRLTNGVMPVGLTLSVDTTGNGYTNVWCRFYAKPTGYDDAGGKPTNTADNMCVFYVNTGGVIKAYNGTTWWTNTNPAFRLDTNKWTGFAVHMNYKNKLWDLYVSTNQAYNENMRKVNTTPLAFCNGVAGTKLQKVRVTGEAYLDGLTLSKAYTTNNAATTTLTAETRYANKLEIASLPLFKYSSPNDTLAGELGKALKAGMNEGDYVRIFVVSNGWNVYRLNSGSWQAQGGAAAPSTLHLPPTAGVIYQRSVGTNWLAFYAQQTLSGLTDPMVCGTNHANRGWNLFAWPYATRGANTAPGLGFASAAVGDRVYIYRNNQYLRLHWDGTQWRNGANVSADSVQEGEGFWYFKPSAGSNTWVVSGVE